MYRQHVARASVVETQEKVKSTNTKLIAVIMLSFAASKCQSRTFELVSWPSFLFKEDTKADRLEMIVFIVNTLKRLLAMPELVSR